MIGNSYQQRPHERESVARFSSIIDRSFCTFAFSSKLDGSPPWVGGARNLSANLNQICGDLIEFVGTPDNDKLDGYVIELVPRLYGESLPSLCVALRKTLNYLSVRDPAEVHAMRKTIESPHWWFSFAGCRFFVSAFAPCYDAAHARSSNGLVSSFFLLLPEYAFVKRVPEGHSIIPEDVRLGIRHAYAVHGRCYDGRISESPIEAYRYIKPLQIGDPPVLWWDVSRFPDDILPLD